MLFIMILPKAHLCLTVQDIKIMKNYTIIVIFCVLLPPLLNLICPLLGPSVSVRHCCAHLLGVVYLGISGYSTCLSVFPGLLFSLCFLSNTSPIRKVSLSIFHSLELCIHFCFSLPFFCLFYPLSKFRASLQISSFLCEVMSIFKSEITNFWR